MTIPKIIHYCWLSDDPIPEKLKKSMNTWKEKLYDYKFILWNFERFDIHTSIWVKQAFESKKYATASDFIRLYAVYYFGGIYLDMDIEIIKPFNNLLNAEYMFGYESNRTKAIEAGCFGAVKGSEYIKLCLDYFNGRHYTSSTISDGYTLPKVMKEIFDKGQDKLSFYSPDYFTAKDFETGIITVTQNTHCIHHFAGSWLSEENHKSINERWEFYKKYKDYAYVLKKDYESVLKNDVNRISLKDLYKIVIKKSIKKIIGKRLSDKITKWRNSRKSQH
jgi:mannosyltransferase OCH1-like enzyme